MKFSDSEEELVERLMNREQRARKWRWFFLVSGILYFLFGCCGCVLAIRFLAGPDGTPGVLVACLLPFLFGMVAVGVALAVSTLLKWNGRLETRLLLSMIQRVQHED